MPSIASPEAEQTQKPQGEKKPGTGRESRANGGQQAAQLLDRLERQATELGQLQERVRQLEHERESERRRRKQLEGSLNRQTEKLRRRNAELETHLQAAWTQLEDLRDEQGSGRRRVRFRFRREPDLVEDR